MRSWLPQLLTVLRLLLAGGCLLLISSLPVLAASTPGFRLFSGEKIWSVRSTHSELYRVSGGDMWNPPDWLHPDYFRGSLYLRFEVLEKPTNDAMSVQLCLIFGDRDSGGVGELCVYRSDLPWFTFEQEGDVVYVKYPPISSWTSHRPRRTWEVGEPFTKVLFQLRHQGRQVKLGDDPRHLGEKARTLLPVRWRAEAYVVPHGGIFKPPAHWLSAPAAWSEAEAAAPGAHRMGQ